jgi:hypothetical protein
MTSSLAAANARDASVDEIAPANADEPNSFTTVLRVMVMLVSASVDI